MAINTTLIAVRNPRWHTLKDFKRDENGASVKDESGNHIIVDVLDANGNTIKVIECETYRSAMLSHQHQRSLGRAPELTYSQLICMKITYRLYTFH